MVEVRSEKGGGGENGRWRGWAAVRIGSHKLTHHDIRWEEAHRRHRSSASWINDNVVTPQQPS